MKYKNAIKKYFIKRSAGIGYFLNLNPKNYKPETFHKLRTEIKKINAVFDILNDCVKSFKRTKTFEPLEIIFKSAGEVRDVQVKKKLFEKYKILPNPNRLASQLEKELRNAKEEFNKQITKKIISGVKRNLASAAEVIAALKHKDVRSYFKKEEEKIKELLKHELKPEKLHELRRQLKIFYYGLRAGGWSRQDVPLHKMDAVQEVLGKWHDVRVAEKYLAARKRQKDISKFAKKRLDGIRINLKKDAEASIKQVAGHNKELVTAIKLFS
jgi:CHAD domain-containing protein